MTRCENCKLRAEDVSIAITKDGKLLATGAFNGFCTLYFKPVFPNGNTVGCESGEEKEGESIKIAL